MIDKEIKIIQTFIKKQNSMNIFFPLQWCSVLISLNHSITLALGFLCRLFVHYFTPRKTIVFFVMFFYFFKNDTNMQRMRQVAPNCFIQFFILKCSTFHHFFLFFFFLVFYTMNTMLGILIQHQCHLNHPTNNLNNLTEHC